METVKRIGLKVAAASVGIAIISGCGSVAPMANNTKELGTTSEVSASFSNNSSFFDLKDMKKQKELREARTDVRELKPIRPVGPIGSVDPIVVTDLPDVKNSNLMTYTVKKGDTLSHIARRFQVGVGELAHVNDMTKNDTLMVGTRLSLPRTAEDRGTARRTVTSGTRTYVIAKGDTLSRIAKRESVTVKQLKEWNGFNSDAIRAGQVIALGPGEIDRGGFKPRKRPIPRDGVHVVQGGENLSSIAYMYGMKTKELKALNSLNDDKILPDQKLVLRDGLASSTAPTGSSTMAPAVAFTGTTVYVVKSGDILGRIAPKFGVTVQQVMTANDMSDTSIKVGQELKIPVREETTATVETTTTPTPTETVEPTPTETVAEAKPEKVATTTDGKKKIVIPHFVDKGGDTLKSIADMYGSTVKDILAENPLVKNDADLAKVTEISVPVPDISLP